MGSIYPKTFNVKRIAVIGAGPCGLAAAKYLKAQGTFDTITVFEQQSQVGGVWNYNTVVPAPNPIPQTNPFYPPDSPVHVPLEKTPIFPSPMYDQLHANIPKPLMNFSDLEFLPQSWIYPGRHDIQDYIVKYAQDVRDLIRFCVQVKSVLLRPQNGEDQWHVVAESTTDGQVTNEVFDAVVVANGHYSTPFIPNIKNISEFHTAHPSIIIHSKNYHSPETFRDKKTIIVGNGPSGQDIAYQINKVSKGQTLLSVRHGTPQEKLDHIGCREIAEIDEFLIPQRGVRLKDGRVETDIDAIVFCTGFRYSLPFLKDLEKDIITNGACVHGLYKHLFLIQHPTIVFSVLNMKIVPFPISEAQAAVFSAVWSNRLHLPPKPEMLRWNRAAEEKAGDKLHVMADGQDGVYLNELHDWAVTASTIAKEPPMWGDEKFWMRSIFHKAKKVFEEQGCKATTLEELGFKYAPGWDD